jgi:nitrogen fixation protein NifU and related proteins
MAYSDKVIEHYNNPRNVGSLDKADPNVGTGLVGAPECGDVMKLQMKVNPETRVIEEAKFKTFGCGSAIASSSLATEWVKGKTVEEALAIKNTDIVRELALPPVKIHCSVLAEDAIKAALGDWKKKQGEPDAKPAETAAARNRGSTSSRAAGELWKLAAWAAGNEYDSRLGKSGGKDPRAAAEGRRAGGIRRITRGCAGGRVLRAELRDAFGYGGAQPRQSLRRKRGAHFRGSQELSLPSRHDARLSRRPDEAGLRLPEPSGDA